MPRVVGIDPGTVSIDVVGLEDGKLWLDRTFPTREALATPQDLVRLLQAQAASPATSQIGADGASKS